MWIVHAFHALYSEGTISRQHLCTHACCLSLRVFNGICLGNRTKYDRGKYWRFCDEVRNGKRLTLSVPIFIWLLRESFGTCLSMCLNQTTMLNGNALFLPYIYRCNVYITYIYIYMYIWTRTEAHRFVSWSKSLFLYGRSLHVITHVSDKKILCTNVLNPFYDINTRARTL